MPNYGECHSITIQGTPEACFDALTDYERLPSWQRAVRSATVLERDAQGRGTVVEYEVDAKVKTVKYRLRQVYDEPSVLGSEYLGGDFKNFSGEWRFVEREDGTTHVELELDIDPGRFVPGPVKNAIREFVMTRALKDLKAHLEAAVHA